MVGEDLWESNQGLDDIKSLGGVGAHVCALARGKGLVQLCANQAAGALTCGLGMNGGGRGHMGVQSRDRQYEKAGWVHVFMCSRGGKGIGAAVCKPSRWGFDLWSGYEAAAERVYGSQIKG